jgi:hypothetical protein
MFFAFRGRKLMLCSCNIIKAGEFLYARYSLLLISYLTVYTPLFCIEVLLGKSQTVHTV